MMEDGDQPPLFAYLSSIALAFLSLLPTVYTLALSHSQDPLPKRSSSSRYLPLQLSLYQQPTTPRSIFCCPCSPE